ncbi:MAG: hypothetical protein A2620_03215 [Acidobacteria bacterium RIFCSPHIGHO2_01_FULL_67_28]|nr:MAG: hypothetical protein A2620_03215 [Acidobacteria bacterium RIFCSPHIGHO2_01_FULL_67_28]
MVPGKTLKLAAGAALAFFLVAGCAVKKTERLPVLALQTATLEDLRGRLERQADAVHTINAEAELVPATGSAYSGVIEQYHDVKAFVLAEQQPGTGGNSLPAQAGRHIRVLGQAPIVRKTIFDMVADEREFRILLPTKNKFVVGPTELERRSEKPIENLRPQHLFEALFPSAPATGPRAQAFLEENEFSGRRYYAVTEIVEAEGAWRPARRWWFDRTDLALVRVQSFDAEGRLLADIHYGQWQETDGIPYPRTIELVRPQEDYRLKLIVKKLTLNQPLPPERFRLEPPAGVETVELKSASADKPDSGKEPR